jgi:hypothetical protein
MSKGVQTSKDAMEDEMDRDALKEMNDDDDMEEEEEGEEKSESNESVISVADARKLRARILTLESNAEEMRKTIRALKARVDECENVTNFIKRGGRFKRLSVGEKARLKAAEAPVPSTPFVAPFELDSLSIRVVPFYPTYDKELPSGTTVGKITYIDISNDDD